MQRIAPLALRQVYAHQQDVAGLGVGEHMAAAHIGIGVHKAPRQRQHGAQLKGFGHLSLASFHLYRLLSSTLTENGAQCKS